MFLDFVWFIAVLLYNRFGLPSDPVKAMEAYSVAPVYPHIPLLFIEVLYILLMAFFLALHERMHATAPYLTRIMLIAISAATAMGFMEVVIWITGMQLIVPTRDVSAYQSSRCHNSMASQRSRSCSYVGYAFRPDGQS